MAELETVLEPRKRQSGALLETVLSPAKDEETAGLLRDVVEAGANFGSGAANFLAAAFGAPVDIVNFGLRQIGVPVSDAPVGGSERFRGALETLGVRPETRGTAGLVGEGVAAGLTLAAPAVGAAGRTAAAAQAGQRGTALLEPILAPARTAPGQFTALEAFMGAGGGLGEAAAAEVAQQFRASPAVEQAARLGGAFVGGLGAGGLAAAPAAIGRGRARVAPFTARGQQREAGEFLRARAADPERALQNLQGRPAQEVGEFTAAQQTRDAGLLALERGILRKEPELQGRFRDLEAATNEQTTREAEDILAAEGSLADAQEVVAQRREQAIRALDDRTAQAIAASQRRIEELESGTRSRENLNQIAREELNLVLEEARQTENQIWNRVAGEEQVDISALREASEGILNEARIETDLPRDIPRDFLRMIPGREQRRTVETGLTDAQGNPITRTEEVTPDTALNAIDTVERVLNFRSNLLAEQRRLRADPAHSRKRVARLGRLADAALETVRSLERNPNVNPQAVQDALDFSRQLNDRFTRGPVGKLLGFEATGGQRTPDIETLERMLVPGVRGGTNMDALIAAAGGREELVGASQEFMRRLFVDTVTDPNGQVNATAMARFRKRFRPILNRMPSLSSDLADMTSAQRMAERVRSSGERFTANLRNPRQSRTALFLDMDPDRALRRVLRSPRQGQAMQAVINAANNDTTGQALAGLKRGMFELLENEVRKNALDDVNQPILRSRDMRNFVTRNRRALDRLYSKEEMGRLIRVAEQLEKFEASARARLAGSDTAANLSIMSQLAGRVLGARLGSAIGAGGGPSLIAAGAGSRAARAVISRLSADEVNRLIQEAVFDPDLMQTLMMAPRNVQTERLFERRLRGHLAALATMDEGGGEER